MKISISRLKGKTKWSFQEISIKVHAKRVSPDEGRFGKGQRKGGKGGSKIPRWARITEGIWLTRTVSSALT